MSWILSPLTHIVRNDLKLCRCKLELELQDNSNSQNCVIEDKINCPGYALNVRRKTKHFSNMYVWIVLSISSWTFSHFLNSIRLHNKYLITFHSLFLSLTVSFSVTPMHNYSNFYLKYFCCTLKKFQATVPCCLAFCSDGTYWGSCP